MDAPGFVSSAALPQANPAASGRSEESGQEGAKEVIEFWTTDSQPERVEVYRAFAARYMAANPHIELLMEPVEEAELISELTQTTEGEPSHGTPASFIASPVHDHNNDFVGVFAFQLPSEPINEIMQFTGGMGQTGETYIVGPDRLMRSDSRFSELSTILKTTVDTQTVGYALENERGFQITNDYRNIPVLSAYSPLEFEGIRWAIMAEIDRAEVLAPITRLRQLVLSIGLLILLIAAVIGLYDTIAHRISRNQIWY